MLTDKTFFTGDIFISNLTEKCDNLHFYEWIEVWEEQCLRTVLGDCIYNDFVAQLEWNEDDEKYQLVDGADDKWDWLLNGHTYTKDDISQSHLFNDFCCGSFSDNCDTFYWDGLVKTIDRRIKATEVNGQTANGIIINKSLISYYIYWLWALKKDSITSSTGEQIADVKNSQRVSNVHQRIDAYNKFVSMTTECSSSGGVGLYKFIQDFSNLFPEWCGKELSYESVW